MTTSTPWVHKYAPKHSRDVVGNAEALAKVRAGIERYKPGDKPMLLVGRPGIGKTSIVHALSHELDLELLEINASDSRNKDAIESIIGGAVSQQSLFFRRKMILIDEVDGVSGSSDRGGIPALIGVLAKSKFSVVLTANDTTADKMKPLLKACTVIELSDIAHEQVLARLQHIAGLENVVIRPEQLSAISRRSSGDVRSAINDLQSLFTGAAISKEDVDGLMARDARDEVRSALLRIFKTTSAEVALPAFDSVDEDVDSLLLWIDENLPREYTKPEDLARAFDALAEADRFFGRIRRWQYYRYYVYIYNLLTAGVATAKDKKYATAVAYKPTGRILKMWIYNQKNAKRKKLSSILAPQLHTSTRRIRQDVLPYLKIIYKQKAERDKFCELYGIDEESAEWFTK